MRELSLFSGAGGGLLGSALLGWKTVAACEIDPYARAVLQARQQDGYLDNFPIYEDVRELDGKQFRGVDIVTGGFPCQDVSSASSDGKRLGIEGTKSGLWREMARICTEAKPKFILVENSPLLRKRGLNVVLSDLAEMGYDAVWGVFGAEACGAPHKRARFWLLAYPNDPVQRKLAFDAEMAGAQEPTRFGADQEPWWPLDCVKGVADGVANRMDKARATGNGQVAPLVPVVWRTLMHIAVTNAK